MILDDIVRWKRIEVAERKKEKPFRVLEQGMTESDGFLKKKNRIQLIAELKAASPSRGIIRKDFSPAVLAAECRDAGADALSVLTDEKFFMGKVSYLSLVKEAVDIPILRKDFIIDEYQVVEARAFGADAVLLIARILKPRLMGKLLELSHSFGMDAVVEVHSHGELDCDCRIVGINNRDLAAGKVDITNTERVMKGIPRDKFIISESGIRGREDIGYLRGLGVDAVLVGESIMSSACAGAKIKELMDGAYEG